MLSSARLGDKHVCPLPGHGTTPIASASGDIDINFMGAARVGDTCGCGAVITTGFPSIILNGRPMAHLGSPTSHGGTIITGSGDTFGGFVMGPAPGAAIINFATLGAIRPDGSVDDEKMATLLADPKLTEKATAANALVDPNGASKAPEETLTPELIAVAGSQHDKSAGNQMMFIGQAVRELAEFKRNKPNLTRTLVIFTPSYSEAMLSAARDSADAYGAGVVTVTNVQGLIDYLNQGKDRKQSPIEHLSLFSHGVPHRIAFGYQLAGDFQMSLDVLSYDKISPSAFASSAQIDSYACRTGMGNRSDFPVEDGIQFFPQTNESLAQLLANHLRIKVHAFIRRSDYKNTWGSFEERQLGKLCDVSDNAAPEEEWCQQWNKLKGERKNYNKAGGFTYQEMGAINPVISGSTPLGIPGGHFEFSPK
ncbi:PAAR domain-containing protein [Pseudomonas chlororaphis]|uniref:PAAR domain-containing protein n=1 Tax=Pseudomonas chlororaphis TaxID=587753 RepID=UPI000F574521|nr:PAAR domain-containing protein [Pseudomonas chlororaphis]